MGRSARSVSFAPASMWTARSSGRRKSRSKPLEVEVEAATRQISIKSPLAPFAVLRSVLRYLHVAVTDLPLASPCLL